MSSPVAAGSEPGCRRLITTNLMTRSQVTVFGGIRIAGACQRHRSHRPYPEDGDPIRPPGNR
jgi:hypothetical protein